jgi:hypothetical protein
MPARLASDGRGLLDASFWPDSSGPKEGSADFPSTYCFTDGSASASNNGC